MWQEPFPRSMAIVRKLTAKSWIGRRMNATVRAHSNPSTGLSHKGHNRDKYDHFAVINVPKFDFDRIRNEIMSQWVESEAESENGTLIKARYCSFTLQDAKREYVKKEANWHWLDRELSSNLAGETGAVYIYKGAISAITMRQLSSDALEFCRSHMSNELSHLSMFQYIVPKGKHTRLLPLWKMAGWTLGFIPTIFGGSRALYVTVEAVETFVEQHFQEQIIPLKKQDKCHELIRLLEHCCEDEVHHKEDAVKQLLDENADLDAWWVQPWSSIVRFGSATAAEIARRV